MRAKKRCFGMYGFSAKSAFTSFSKSALSITKLSLSNDSLINCMVIALSVTKSVFALTVPVNTLSVNIRNIDLFLSFILFALS